MSRKSARKHTFLLIYSNIFNPLTPENKRLLLEDIGSVEDFEKDFNSKEDLDYIEAHVSGVMDNLERIDEIISGNLNRGTESEPKPPSVFAKKKPQNWTIERLSKIDLSLMRLCVYEALFKKEVPVKVCINEIVELAKEFGDDDSYRFINGNLGQIVKEAQPPKPEEV